MGISKQAKCKTQGDVSQPSIGNSGNQQTIALSQASCKGTLASQQGEVDCQMQQWESARSCTLAKCKLQGNDSQPTGNSGNQQAVAHWQNASWTKCVLEGDVSQALIGSSGDQQATALWQNARCKGTLANQQLPEATEGISKKLHIGKM